MAAKAWGGRFQQQTDARVEAFTESISFDSRLAAVDIKGSQAHAQMLAKVGLISDEECQQILEVLTQIGVEIEQGQFEFRFDLEDIHMHIESALIERVGDIGRKLHTARSRNDQVSTDLKLYTREAIHRIDSLLKDLQVAFVERFERDQDLVLPGFTHLQRAQPVKAAHYWFAYCEKFDRDRQRLQDCLKRVNVSPLGGAALAGTSLPIDRQYTAQLLEFTDVARNSLDISSDRDYLAEFCFCMALVATHLSNWAEEWIAWFSTEFGFIKLPDAFTTGSSIMPQKRNPDVLELIRGKSARPIADVQQILVLLKGLPMAYNRDMQEDKLALFDSYDTVAACLELAAAMVEGAELQQETITAKLEDGFLDATALMEYLIKKGTPMRTGHGIVGKLVALCESRQSRLVDLSLEELQQACPQIEDDIYQILGARNAMAALCSFGSGGEEPVNEQWQYWKEKLGI
ncbi:argininosuccinate lyase [Gimesia aquarii]|uniref:Argininosuccinate lyase n=1 Tax=Gimesia aquarii TaxID=2527964 RepID=A0A517VVB1_9PLAN|nr:argininosuccinate lyase [Gimesia aquarii]QDT96954.1 Argininosuccinate lyase [Gimesia aquarii]